MIAKGHGVSLRGDKNVLKLVWGFPGGPMAKIPCSESRGPGFKPWSGN